MDSSIVRAIKKYPGIGELDIHYYGLKGYGIADDRIKEGHPKLHLIHGGSLFSVTALISSPESLYKLTDKLRFRGKELPFNVKYIGRVQRTLGYFYYRGIQEWIPTLDSETILSTNFNPRCSGCSWCSRVECSPEEKGKSLRNIDGKSGIEFVVQQGVDLTKINKITIVTGIFKNEAETVKHITEIIETSKKYGFNGRMLYIGSQIKSPKGVQRTLEGLDGTPFKYAYTLETFTNRNKMHKLKRDSLEVAIDTIEDIKDAGIDNLEYSYIPGIDTIKEFARIAPKLCGVARPHLSIFRPATEVQKNLPCGEFLDDPVDYLCQMRLIYEKLYEGPIYANNLANLWPFPISRINPLFLTDKTSLR